MSRDVSRFVAFLGAVAALGLVIGVFGGWALRSTGGPQAAIVLHLKRLERDGLEQQLPWANLTAAKLQFERISVVLDADGLGATVISTLDLTGELRRKNGSTKVSSLGLERARYRLDGSEWKPEGTPCPRLLAILSALEERRAALEEGALDEISGRTYQSLAWFIRSEREEVLVSEDFRLQGTTPQRPVDDKGTRRFRLIETGSTGLFSFPDGIR